VAKLVFAPQSLAQPLVPDKRFPSVSAFALAVRVSYRTRHT